MPLKRSNYCRHWKGKIIADIIKVKLLPTLKRSNYCQHWKGQIIADIEKVRLLPILKRWNYCRHWKGKIIADRIKSGAKKCCHTDTFTSSSHLSPSTILAVGGKLIPWWLRFSKIFLTKPWSHCCCTQEKVGMRRNRTLHLQWVSLSCKLHNAEKYCPTLRARLFFMGPIYMLTLL